MLGLWDRNTDEMGHLGENRTGDRQTSWLAIAAGRARLFRRNEDGSLLIFSLFIFVLMILMGGMAVDLMRFETRRTSLQNTIDTAVLAAANLDQEIDSEVLVKDFFTKVGLDPDLVTVTPTPEYVGGDGTPENPGELIGRTVVANADLYVDTFFMHMIGIDELQSVSTGAALERVQNVEISLVVDISGSMRGSKLTALKSSAKNFFEAVIGTEENFDPNETQGITTVSIVPYNHAVVVPDDLLDRINADGVVAVSDPWPPGPVDLPDAADDYPRTSLESKCVRFHDDDMKATGLIEDVYADLRAVGPDTPLDRIAFFDESGKSSGSGGSYDRPAYDWNRWCNPNRAAIMPFGTDPGDLGDHIDTLTAGGWTASDNGMKWGVALLDPAFRPIVNDMTNVSPTPLLPTRVQNRPGDYDEQTLKVIVLMTDGANTTQKDVISDLDDDDWGNDSVNYKNGPSRLWYSQQMADAGDGWYDGYLIEMPNNGDSTYWAQPRRPWDRNDHVYHDKDIVDNASINDPTGVWGNGDGPASDAVQQNWAELYERFAEHALAEWFRNIDNGVRNDIRSSVRTVENGAKADNRMNGDPDTVADSAGTLYGICDAAKHEGEILVFTIAFSAGSGGEAVMRECASPGGYYNANSATALNEAFSAIAGKITSLRLTQ